MSVLKVLKMGNPVLRTIAKPVVFPMDDTTKTLINDMVETLADQQGAGLAAPQVGHSLRIIVVLLGDEVLTLLNPELVPVGDETEWAFEGCLSLPGLRGAVPRHAHVAWTAQDMDGQPVGGEVSDFSARLLQHEVDHLDGILYPDVMPDLRLLTYLDEIHNFQPADDDAETLEGEDHE
ncbi:MAG TPA: peptide deformylase [Rhodospirillaceae bacterium]|nr:peptide deformylase [Rhodospirillaceae bacterium]